MWAHILDHTVSSSRRSLELFGRLDLSGLTSCFKEKGGGGGTGVSPQKSVPQKLNLRITYFIFLTRSIGQCTCKWVRAWAVLCVWRVWLRVGCEFTYIHSIDINTQSFESCSTASSTTVNIHIDRFIYSTK